jgi:uncharacterized protein YqjF (DUF2071 family)
MNPAAVLREAAHRPYPLPTGPWIMTQIWHELLFAHWPLPPATLRPLVPAVLPLDTFDGQAWLGIVPFRMTYVRPRGVPPLPGISAFAELNVRTYVSLGGKPGVYFFSLDAANRLAVALARAVYHLPYMDANMRCLRSGDTITYTSRRLRRGPPAAFEANYRPIGPAFTARPDSLDAWLTERYCLYAVTPSGGVFRGEIHHGPWPLQPAEAVIRVNTMAQAAGVALPDIPPRLAYTQRQEVLIWPLRRARVNHPSADEALPAGGRRP